MYSPSSAMSISPNETPNSNEDPIYPLKIKREDYQIDDLDQISNHPFIELRQWEIHHKDIDNWIEPDKCYKYKKKRTGCAIDSLHFLKILPKEVANYLSKHRTFIREGGTQLYEILDLIKEYEMEIENKELIQANYLLYIKQNHGTNIDNIDLAIKYFDKILKESHATLLTLMTANNGHTTTLVKYNGKIIVFDPQLNMVFDDLREYIEKWSDNSDYCYMFIYLNIQSQLYNQDKHIKQETGRTFDFGKLDYLKIDAVMIHEWKILNQDIIPRNNAYDCYYNVLAFLKIIDYNEAKLYSLQANTKSLEDKTNKAVIYENFFDLLSNHYYSKKYQKHSFHLRNVEIENNEYLLETFFKNNLENETGTIVWLNRKDPKMIGHCIIVYKDIVGHLYFLDPQQGKIHPLINWTGWLEKHGFISFEMIFKSISLKRRREKEKREPSSSQKTKKAKTIRKLNSLKGKGRKTVKKSIFELSNIFSKMKL